MDQITVKRYKSSEKLSWDSFVIRACNATFLFQRNFMDYHQDRFDDHSLMVYSKDKLVAILPAHKVRDELNSHQGLTYGGLCFEANTRLADQATILKSVLKFLFDEGVETLTIKTIPNFYKSIPDDGLDYLLSSFGKLNNQKLFTVSTILTAEFSNSRKEGFRRGEVNGLRLEEVNDFSDFWNSILIPNLQEKHGVKPVHSLEEISRLKHNFPENIRQFNIYHNDSLVAGATIFETEFVAHLQYISGNSEKNKLGSLDYLITKLITETFNDKRYFDFGTSHHSDGSINAGLHFWKEGFGGFGAIQNCFSINTEDYTKIDDLF